MRRGKKAISGERMQGTAKRKSLCESKARTQSLHVLSSLVGKGQGSMSKPKRGSVVMLRCKFVAANDTWQAALSIADLQSGMHGHYTRCPVDSDLASCWVSVEPYVV